MTAQLNIQMALESVNPPVIITARDFFLRSKNQQHLEQKACYILIYSI